jgi:hypothetical protein
MVNSVLIYIQTFSWDNPASYLIIVLLCLAFMKKWSILVLSFLTYVLASVASDLIVTNIQTAQMVIGVPLVIYCIGGSIITIIALISFVRYMLE